MTADSGWRSDWQDTEKKPFQEVTNRLPAVIWWALLVRVTWVTRQNESAVPGVATPACTSALPHPMPSKRFPMAFRAAISMCSPPNITKNLSSPWVPGQFHWICFAIVYRGWSAVIMGTWPGFKLCTALLTMSIEWRIMAMEWAWSWKWGSWEVAVTQHSDNLLEGCRLAWYADQETASASFTVSLVTTRFTSCNHL